MSLNNVKFFADDNNFISLTFLTKNNVIVIGGLKYGVISNNTNTNHVYCSFRGKYLKQIIVENFDEVDSIDCFAYETTNDNKGYIKLVVDKTIVTDIASAKDYIRGLLIDYELTEIIPTGSAKEPLFELSTYLSDGTLISPTIACSMSDIFNKIIALETNFDINEIGFYNHIIQRAIIRK